MQDIELIITQLCEKTKKDRYEVKKLIEDKQVKFKHQISEIAAAKILAKELNIILAQQRKKTTNIDEILHLPPGTQDISFKGIISRIYSILDFNRSQGVGKVQHIIIKDNSGEIRLILWDRMVDLALKIELNIGKRVQIYKGIVRMGKSGEREIHLNELSNIQLIDQNKEEEEFPDVLANILAPNLIKNTDKNKEIDLKGIISSKREVRTFQKDEREGMLLPMTICDEKEHINLIAWGEKVSEFNGLEIGDEVLIQGVNVKTNRNNQLEVHVNRRSFLEVLSKSNNIPNPISTSNLVSENQSTRDLQKSENKQTINISDLEKTPYSRIVAKICFSEPIRSFTRKEGSEGYIKRIGIFDKSGSNVLVIWDDIAQKADNWKIGSILDISEAYLRDNPRGGKEVYVTRSAIINNLEDKKNDIPEEIPIIPIIDLNKNWKIASISGKILDISDTREFTRQKDDSIGQVRWLRIADKTGSTRVVAWNDQVLEYDIIQLDEIIMVHNALIQVQEAGTELHLSRNSLIKTSDFNQAIPDWADFSDFSVPEFPSQGFTIEEFVRTNTLKLNLENSHIELRARVKQLGDREPYYFACPKCSQKISDSLVDSAVCSRDGDQKPIPKLRIPLVLDDGFGTLYTTLFNPTAELLTGVNERKLFSTDNLDEVSDTIKERILGKDYIFQGILKERLVGDPPKKVWNFNVRNVYSPNTIYEIDLIYNQLIEENT
jgi:replication factor A1